MNDLRTAFARYRPIVGDWVGFLDACSTALPTCIWVRDPDDDAVLGAIREDGISGLPLGWISDGIRLGTDPDLRRSLAYRAGLFHVMEDVSMLPVALLAPEPGERILDLCAAPGNKTALIAHRMGNRGTVVANDPNRGRQAVTRTTTHRLGLTNVTLTAVDGADERWCGLAFDRVLVDAPCSCEGTVRKHPRTATRTTQPMRDRLAETQRRLLRTALRACRPGGRVVYATCTFAPEENEAVVDDVLRGMPGYARVVPTRVPLPACRPGLSSWEGRRFGTDLRHAIRVWPHEGGGGGFFCVVLERAGSGGSSDSFPVEPPGLPHDDSRVRPVLDPILDRFGIAPEAAGRFLYRSDSDRYLTMVSRDHRPGLPFPVLATGLSAVRRKRAVPKPTTQAVVALGRALTRSLVDLDRPAALEYVGRRTLDLDRDAAGYQVVRWRGFPLGLGHGRPTSAGARLESLHPRTWGGLQPPESDH